MRKIENAKSWNFDTNLRQSKNVKEFQTNLDFFIKHKLIRQAEKEKIRLDHYLEQFELQRDMMQITQSLSIVAELIDKMLKNLIHQRLNMNYFQLVKTMKDIIDQFAQFDSKAKSTEQETEIEELKLKAK